MDQWTNEWTNRWDQLTGPIDGTNKWTDGPMDRWTDGPMYGQTTLGSRPVISLATLLNGAALVTATVGAAQIENRLQL